MKLVVSENEFQELVDKRIIVPRSQSVFRLALDTFNIRQSIWLDVEVELNNDILNEEGETVTDVNGGTKLCLHTDDEIEDEFNKFWKVFPANAGFAHFSKEHNMRNIPKSVALERFKLLVEDSGLKPEDITLAAKYEVSWRKKISMENNVNKLKYMFAMRRWLQDPDNVVTQLETMKEDDSVSNDGEIIDPTSNDRTAQLL